MIAKPGKYRKLSASYRSCLLKLCFLVSGNTIPNHQFSFREKHCTVNQVDRVPEEIRKCFEQKNTAQESS